MEQPLFIPSQLLALEPVSAEKRIGLVRIWIVRIRVWIRVRIVIGRIEAIRERDDEREPAVVSSSAKEDGVRLIFRNRLVLVFRLVSLKLLIVSLIRLHGATALLSFVCTCSSIIRDIRLCGELSSWIWAQNSPSRKARFEMGLGHAEDGC